MERRRKKRLTFEMKKAQRKKIERLTQRLCEGRLTKAERKELERLSKKWLKKLEPHRKAILESTRITGEDLATRVNI